jgi:hypothetical protein
MSWFSDFVDSIREARGFSAAAASNSSQSDSAAGRLYLRVIEEWCLWTLRHMGKMMYC